MYDWDCPKCTNRNKYKHERCILCKTGRPAGAGNKPPAVKAASSPRKVDRPAAGAATADPAPAVSAADLSEQWEASLPPVPAEPIPAEPIQAEAEEYPTREEAEAARDAAAITMSSEQVQLAIEAAYA